MPECRATIIENFAKWTALSALRRAPVSKGERIYPLMTEIANSALLCQSGLPISAEEFATWHRSATLRICSLETMLCVGWATKLINVFLKTAAYVGDLGRPGLRQLLHPPIDGKLLEGLKRRFKDQSGLLAKTHIAGRIKGIRNYQTYETIMDGCREAAEHLKCLLIEVEQLWDPTNQSET